MYVFYAFNFEFVTCSISATGFLELINKYKYKYNIDILNKKINARVNATNIFKK
jgi:hypothetical protein